MPMKRSVTASARRNRVLSNDHRVSHVNYDHKQDVLEDVDVEDDSAVELVFTDEDDGGEDMGGMDSSREESEAEGSGDDVGQVGGRRLTNAPRKGVLTLPNTVGMSVEEKETEHERSMALRPLAVIRG